MELKVYRSGSASAAPGGGTRRRRGTKQPVHGTDRRGPGRARHRRRHVRLPLHDGAAQRSRSAAGARAGLARRDSSRRAASWAACRCSSAASRWAAASRRRSRRRACDGLAGLVFLGYPLHPPGKPEQRRDAHLPAIREPMLFVQGTRDAFGTADEIRALLPKLQRATLHEVAGGDHSFKVSGRGAPKPDVVLDQILDVVKTGCWRGSDNFQLQLPKAKASQLELPRQRPRPPTASVPPDSVRRPRFSRLEVDLGVAKLDGWELALADCYSATMRIVAWLRSLLRRGRAAAARPHPQPRRDSRSVQVEPGRHLPELGGLGGAYDRLEKGIERYAALKGTLAQGPERLLEAFRLSEELGQLAYRVWYFPVAALRRRPARQHGQRAPPAGAAAVRALEAGGVLVQPRAAQHPARDGARLDGRRSKRCGSTASRSRISIASRSTCWTRPASG